MPLLHVAKSDNPVPPTYLRSQLRPLVARITQVWAHYRARWRRILLSFLITILLHSVLVTMDGQGETPRDIWVSSHIGIPLCMGLFVYFFLSVRFTLLSKSQRIPLNQAVKSGDFEKVEFLNAEMKKRCESTGMSWSEPLAILLLVSMGMNRKDWDHTERLAFPTRGGRPAENYLWAASNASGLT